MPTAHVKTYGCTPNTGRATRCGLSTSARRSCAVRSNSLTERQTRLPAPAFRSTPRLITGLTGPSLPIMLHGTADTTTERKQSSITQIPRQIMLMPWLFPIRQRPASSRATPAGPTARSASLSLTGAQRFPRQVTAMTSLTECLSAKSVETCSPVSGRTARTTKTAFLCSTISLLTANTTFLRTASKAAFTPVLFRSTTSGAIQSSAPLPAAGL